MRDRMTEALKASSAEYAEIRIESSVISEYAFRGSELDSVDAFSSTGGMVRALYRGGWGITTFNSLDDLDERVRQACESARHVGHEQTHFAHVDPVLAETHAQMARDFRMVSLEEKIAVGKRYNEILLETNDAIETSTVRYADRFRTVRFANTDGAWLYDERPYVSMHLAAIARRGDLVQPAVESRAGQQGFSVVEGLHTRARDAVQRATSLLDAEPVKAGSYTVILDPKLAGVFAHEAFGHLSEADHVHENDRLRELMTIGKRFGPEFLHIIDDGTFPGQQGTHAYDDEGVPCSRNPLIEGGVLVGRLHSRETAARMGERPTGNARAIGYASPPIVRMTNTYIAQGQTSFEDMIADIPLGVYACGMQGGQTAMEMFTFSASHGFMIRNGRIAEPVRDVVLTGNVFETLMNIEAIGDSVEWPCTGGGCGKGGQGPLPCGFGGPHVRIRNVVVGGRQG